MGMAFTPTSIPASRNLLTASSRKSGRGARGSSSRARRVRMQATLILTRTVERSAMRWSKSMSRTIWFDLVVISRISPSRAAIFSRIARVAPNSRSAGW